MSSDTFSPLVLGTNVFGWTTNTADAHAILDRYVDAGGVWLDTADVYSAWGGPNNVGGESETIIGQWLAKPGNRDKVRIATKVAKWSKHPGLSADNIEAAVAGSLQRLQTDHIDLYYAHQDDDETPQAEYVQKFDELVTEGTVSLVGASNFGAGRLRSAVEYAAAHNYTPFSVSEDQYNLLDRQYEVDLEPTIADLGLIELPYYALASGFLTGKYRNNNAHESARASDVEAYLQRPNVDALLDTMAEIAAAHHTSVANVALAWLRAQPTVAAPIASARTLEQLEGLIASFSIDLTSGEVAALSDIDTAAK